MVECGKAASAAVGVGTAALEALGTAPGPVVVVDVVSDGEEAAAASEAAEAPAEAPEAAASEATADDADEAAASEATADEADESALSEAAADEADEAVPAAASATVEEADKAAAAATAKADDDEAAAATEVTHVICLLVFYIVEGCEEVGMGLCLLQHLFISGEHKPKPRPPTPQSPPGLVFGLGGAGL